MKRTNLSLLLTGLLAAGAAGLSAQVTPVSQMEKLNRAPVAIPYQGEFISWRFLGTDDEAATTFDVVRDGEVIASDIADATCYHDKQGKETSIYQIVTKVNGTVTETTDEFRPWMNNYFKLKLQRPADGSDCTYSPNDCSVGDVDGDGQMEIFVKWDPSNSKDNSQDGRTGNVYLDCYRFDAGVGGASAEAELLWRVDLGVNIRAGAHYTQFMVYDFDGDGRAELMCKTAPGSKDGQGNYVNQAATDATIKAASNTVDHRNSGGRITGGQEYLTVFEGLTGRAIHTIFYNPNRNQGYGGAADGSFNWGKPDGKNDAASYGNRGERYLAAVAYLDGPDKNPSGVFVRGYYGYAFLWAVDFDGEQLRQKWLNASTEKTRYSVTTYDADGNGTTQEYTTGNGTAGSAGNGSGTMYANGNHNLSVADVDGDGCDEIVWGSATCNNDGTVLCATGFGHGDAIHLAKHNPDREGYQVFQIHEETYTSAAWDLHDPATGEILCMGDPTNADNGRGMAAQLAAGFRGSFMSSSKDRNQRSAVNGSVVSTKSTSMNFRIYWDGDLQDDLLDGTEITHWQGNGTSSIINFATSNASTTCNSTKATPNLTCDLFGDWREEVILWSSNDAATLNIFSTRTATEYRVPTLLHDHVYRMGICWQNVAYNQPPHLGYYLPDRFDPSHSAIATVGADARTVTAIYSLSGLRLPATDISDLPRGIYIVRQGNTTRKLLKE